MWAGAPGLSEFCGTNERVQRSSRLSSVPDRRMRTIRAAKGALLDCGALGAVMTGTGSAVFGVFRDEEKAEQARAALAKEYRFCCTAEAVGALL